MLFSQRTGIWIAGFIAHVAAAPPTHILPTPLPVAESITGATAGAEEVPSAGGADALAFLRQVEASDDATVH